MTNRINKTSKRLRQLEVARTVAVYRMESLENESVDLQERTISEIMDNKTMMVRMEESLETARAELGVAEKTVGALVASNKLLTDRWDAQSAIEARRRMAASTTPEET